MRVPTGNLRGLTCKGIVGPWPCEQCGELSQYADIQKRINRIFCQNEDCDFERIIDKHLNRIKENDGTIWEFDGDGNKHRVRDRV